jgi:hypothetical protein
MFQDNMPEELLEELLPHWASFSRTACLSLFEGLTPATS